ncbi:DUF2007 domain-containing protein [Sphingobacterium phlebotomi]|uniref:DUF2007 domain-containing protein n=1 Tax=Sphingobacterium phlebotomi TaxID=2605433 RepID=A0A5D4H044_9SPHI|nr:DUF2007 domain-containing protein [Sphingobacterium phlebotomi]TYR32190.1 DUF2007 domain-containing protein [Sphingobacterium phlebotomi]
MKSSSDNDPFVFRTFSSIEDAKNYQNILAESDIQSNIKDIPPGVDMSFLGSTAGHEYELQIHRADEDRANTLIAKYEEAELIASEGDHYLYQFTNKELIEILQKPDEWSKFDYRLANEILLERGEEVDSDMLTAMKNERLLDLAKPEKSKRYMIVMGYIFSILGGALGIAIGYALSNAKKTLPNGEKVWSYTVQDRKHGRIIFGIGVTVLSILFLLKITDTNPNKLLNHLIY